MHIEIEVKSHYGNTLYYPVCDKSILLARLAGTKTLTLESILTIKELGYNIKVKQPTIEV